MVLLNPLLEDRPDGSYTLSGGHLLSGESQDLNRFFEVGPTFAAGSTICQVTFDSTPVRCLKVAHPRRRARRCPPPGVEAADAPIRRTDNA